jgi:hypothetical protein
MTLLLALPLATTFPGEPVDDGSHFDDGYGRVD